MNKEELQKTYQTIVLNTNGGIDDYVVALCQIGNAISELDDQQQIITDLQHRLKVADIALKFAVDIANIKSNHFWTIKELKEKAEKEAKGE